MRSPKEGLDQINMLPLNFSHRSMGVWNSLPNTIRNLLNSYPCCNKMLFFQAACLSPLVSSWSVLCWFLVQCDLLKSCHISYLAVFYGTMHLETMLVLLQWNFPFGPFVCSCEMHHCCNRFIFWTVFRDVHHRWTVYDFNINHYYESSCRTR